jgi:uncharacterized DUF497 family protein
VAEPLFEWDETKASINLEKHGVSFQEASSVFGDPLARMLPDPTDPSGEDHAIMMGHSDHGRLLLVVFTDRAERIRIIGARMASRRERHEYEEQPS